MKREQFQVLVKQLEQYAIRRPVAYKLRIGGLAAVGYLYVFFVLLLVLALIALGGWAMFAGDNINGGVIKLEIVLVLFAGVILRSLWVQFPRPVGIKLRRESLPELFILIDDLTRRLRPPDFSYVLLTNEFNAAVMQRPLLGVFGWHENYLLLGLPLMEALTPGQFRAVVAHELGHMSGQHGRFSAWIYRIRQTWVQLNVSFHNRRGFGSKFFLRFLDWYAPYFDAYSFVLARAHEYEADRCAAELTSPEIAAEALVQVQLRGQLLEQSFWPAINRQIREQPEPPAALFTGMCETLRTDMPADAKSNWLTKVLSETTGLDDTHPSLSDRLASLGQTILPEASTIAGTPAPSAADQFLGADRQKYITAFNQRWHKEATDQWCQRHQQVRAALDRLEQLNARAQAGRLPEIEAWEHVCLTMEHEGENVALPLLERFAANHPEHHAGLFALGRVLLQRGDKGGIALVERAMAAEMDYILTGCELIVHFLRTHGRSDEIAEYEKRATQHYDLLVAAQPERATVSEHDKCAPHGLSAPVVELLRQQLEKREEVECAYLLRKSVKVLPEKPLFVLVVRMATIWYKYSTQSKQQVFAEQIAREIQFDHPFFVFIATSEGHRLIRKAQKLEGTLIFKR